MGPILNTIIGAGIKLGCNLINAWLEQKRQDQLMLAARDQAMMDAAEEIATEIQATLEHCGQTIVADVAAASHVLYGPPCGKRLDGKGSFAVPPPGAPTLPPRMPIADAGYRRPEGFCCEWK